MQRWEYKVCEITYTNGQGLENALNQLGGEGWRMIHVQAVDSPLSTDGVVHCVFERPALVEALPAFLLPGSEAQPWPTVEKLREMLEKAADGQRKPMGARVVDVSRSIIMEWQEFITEELEALTGQKWNVAASCCESSLCYCDDVRFVCYWDGHNISMPPISFHRLASGDAKEELRERAKQIAQARASL